MTQMTEQDKLSLAYNSLIRWAKDGLGIFIRSSSGSDKDLVVKDLYPDRFFVEVDKFTSPMSWGYIYMLDRAIRFIEYEMYQRAIPREQVLNDKILFVLKDSADVPRSP
jgi:hypothetical protein